MAILAFAIAIGMEQSLFITGAAMMSTLPWRASTPIVVVNAWSPSPVRLCVRSGALLTGKAAAVAAVLTRELQRIDLARDGDVAVGES